MIGFIALWSHALAAVLYGSLAVWQLRHWNRDAANRPLVAAFAVTSVWAILVALDGPLGMAAAIAEAARNFGFLAFMYALFCSADGDEDRQRAVKAVYTVVAGVIGLQLTVGGVAPQFAGNHAVYAALLSTNQILGLTVAAGSLILVHNLYGQAAPDSRSGLRLPMIALAGLWAYDLHLYTIAYLTRGPVEIYAMRGAVVAALVPLFALASRNRLEWRVRMSRTATFQSVSLLAILSYLIVMMTATRALEAVGGEWVRIGQIAIIFTMTMAAGVLLPSGRMRAWARVLLTKHLFEHRYDYREEWLRFTRTMGAAGDDAAPLGERIVKALADIADAPAGLLLVREEGGRLEPAASWRWQGEAAPTGDESAFIAFMERHTFVADVDDARRAGLRASGEALVLPAWLAEADAAWAGVPLLHNDRLVGFVLLAYPPVRRPLDWEDYDLFRTAGIQAASYLAEARSQEALASASRFDEFNRRFAFIMHDIKNLVSQIGLVIRNAERHADKPEFREDMIATLESSVKKMNDLLARLSRGNANVEAEPVRTMALDRSAATVAQVKSRVHPVELTGERGLAVTADPARLEQALMHLVQNAIDASPPGAPVTIELARIGEAAAVRVVDRGAGMSADFIRTRLFQPFASTKDGGFGVGAYEARALVAAMGAQLEVESRPGEGSRFTILLPLAEAAPSAQTRKSA